MRKPKSKTAGHDMARGASKKMVLYPIYILDVDDF